MKPGQRLVSALCKAMALCLAFCLLPGCAWIMPCFTKGEQCPQVRAHN
ncbi:putative lipoprotein [Collimonas pratensis]|uniref:Putative lipoprotein n=1 Tax=Collimonas pratensis TaxID=279113 RepID=A0A127QBN6_9BURK|nr:putative lipoprotein [Collimonas pratensis]